MKRTPPGVRRGYVSLGRVALVVCVWLALLQASAAHAQGDDPQQSARGLSVMHNEARKTAGLAWTVQAQAWPSLSLQGGVRDAGWGTIAGPVGIQLGSVTLPGAGNAVLSAEAVDWAHNEMTFTAPGSASLRVWVSRLTPALLVQTSAPTARLLAGEVAGDTFDGSQIRPRANGPGYPKYVAYSSGGQTAVRALSSAPTSLTGLDQNWLLIWYASNSHFVDTKAPLTYASFDADDVSLPHAYAYQADAPLLLVFETAPQAISHSPEGGIDLTFGGDGGRISMLPLFGRQRLRATETEGWSQGLPDTVRQKVAFWARRLCAYPTGVTETYAYDTDTDTARIAEDITFIPVCSGGIPFAPLPPALAMIKDTLRVGFSAAVVDGGLATEFGPYLGIDNTHAYEWRVAGLKKYVDGRRRSLRGRVPADLEQELTSEVSKLLSAGHMAPWVFADNIPRGNVRGDIYWLNPADILSPLSQVAAVVPDEARGPLIDYARGERQSYPPESIANLPLDQGTPRRAFALSGPGIFDQWRAVRQDVFLKRVPTYSLAGLADYYDLSGDGVSPAVWSQANAALAADLHEQDWASQSWFKGFDDRRIAVINANRYFAGLVGYVRLATRVGDPRARGMGMALLAKAIVLRLSMLEYPRYLASANLLQLPADPAWQPRYSAGRWTGHVFNYNWRGPDDDHRQVAGLDQFGVFLYDTSALREPGSAYQDWQSGTTSAHLTAYRDMTPELARVLTDYARDNAPIYAATVEANFPHWYAAFAEGMLGQEHNLSHPIDSYQVFMAKAWLQKERPDRLARYASMPWLETGDLFYLHKLAETILAYRGWVWDDLPACVRSLAGDVNCDCRVDNSDLDLVARGWGARAGSPAYQYRYDLNQDGRLDVRDIVIVSGYWGGRC